MPYKDIKTQREYQKEWAARRREKWVLLMGGKCTHCGSDERLEFDHLDPTQKTSHRIWTWKEERIAKELEKCQLLCRQCHQNKTAEERMPPHGTETRYSSHKCRCNLCKLARKVAKATNRRRRKEAGLPYQ